MQRVQVRARQAGRANGGAEPQLPSLDQRRWGACRTDGLPAFSNRRFRLCEPAPPSYPSHHTGAPPPSPPHHSLQGLAILCPVVRTFMRASILCHLYGFCAITVCLLLSWTEPVGCALRMHRLQQLRLPWSSIIIVHAMTPPPPPLPHPEQKCVLAAVRQSISCVQWPWSMGLSAPINTGSPRNHFLQLAHALVRIGRLECGKYAFPGLPTVMHMSSVMAAASTLYTCLAFASMHGYKTCEHAFLPLWNPHCHED